MITRDDVVSKLRDYLYHKIDLDELVSWAENAMMEEDFDEKHYSSLKNIVARLGLSDIQAFGLTWDDCKNMLEQLGCTVELDVKEAI